jgi:hypothetical protein
MRNTNEKSGTMKPAAKMEYCHGSVCIGNKVPTHCICPITKK